MSEEKQSVPVVSYIVSAIAAAALVYLAAYSYSVQSCSFVISTGPHVPGVILDVPATYGRPGYPLTDLAFSGHQDFWEWFYGPAHWADRKLRPTVWYRVIGRK